MAPEKKESLPVLPLEVIDRSVGKRVDVLMTSDKEFQGTLVGFDDYVNLVLENAVERSGDGTETTPIKRLLLNSAHVAMIVPQS